MQNKDKDEAPGGMSVQSEEHSWSYAPYLMGKAQAVVCPFPRQPESDNQDSNNSEELCQIRAREDMSSPEGDIQNESIIIVESKQQDENIINVTMDDGSEKLRIQDDSLLDKLESFQNYSLSQTFTLHQSFQAILSDIKQQEMIASGVETPEASGEQQQHGQTETIGESQADGLTVVKQEESKGDLVYANDPKYESIVQAALMASGISQDAVSDASTNVNIENSEAQRNPKRKRQPSPDVRPMAIVKSESVEESPKKEDAKIPSNHSAPQCVPLNTAYTRIIQIRSKTNTVLNLTTPPSGEASKQSHEVSPRPQSIPMSSPETQSSQLQSWQQFMTKYLPNQNPTPPWISVNGQPIQSQPKQENLSHAPPNQPTECTKIKETFEMKQSPKDDNRPVSVKLEPKDDSSGGIPTNQNKNLCEPRVQPKIELNSTSNPVEQPKGTSPKMILKDMMPKITHFGVSPMSESTPILEHHKSRTKLSPLFPMMPETTPEFQRTLKRVAMSASPTNLPNNSGILAESTPENHLQNARSKLSVSPNNFPDFSGRLSPFNDPFFFPPPAHQNQLRQTSPTNFRQLSPTGYLGMHQPAPAHHGMDMYYGSHNPYPPFYGNMYSNPYQNPMHHNMMYHQNSMYQQQYHHQQMPLPFGIPPYSQQNAQETDDSHKKESIKTNKQHEPFGHPFNFPPFLSHPKGQQHNPPPSSQHQDPLKQSPRQKQQLDQSAQAPGNAHHPIVRDSHPSQNPELTKAHNPQQLHHGHQFLTSANGAHQNPDNESLNPKSETPDSFGLSLPLQPPASMKLMITPPGLKKQELQNFYKDTSVDNNHPSRGNTEQSQGQQHPGGFPNNFTHNRMPHSNVGITRLPHQPHHGLQKPLQTSNGAQTVNHGPPQIHHGPRLGHQHPHLPNNVNVPGHYIHLPTPNRPPSVQPPNIHPNSANQTNASSHPSNTSTEEPDPTSEHKEEEQAITGPPPNNKRKGRINYTSKQLNAMDRAFEGDPYPKPDLLDHLSSELQIPVSKLKVWFQNKRARARKKGGEKSVQPPSDKFNQVYKNLMAFRKPMMMPEHSVPNDQQHQYPSMAHSTVSAISNHPGSVTSHPPVSAMSHPPGSHLSGSVQTHPPGSVTAHQSGSVTSHQSGSVTSHQSGPVPPHQTGPIPSHQTGSVPSHQTGSVPSHQTGSVPSHQTGSVPSHQSGSLPSHHSEYVTSYLHGSMSSHPSVSAMPRPQALMPHPSASAHHPGTVTSRHPVSNMSRFPLPGMQHSSNMSVHLRPPMSAMSHASMLPIPSLPPEK